MSASTVLARIAGYREALFAYGIPLQQNLVCRGDPDNPDFIQRVLKDCRPDAIVCANDFTAARVMAGLVSHGIRVPDEMRIVGIDDVKYSAPAGAADYPTPELRRYRAMAMVTMLQRVEKPDLPTRDILLQTHTVIRRSCGTHRSGLRNSLR